MSKTPVSSTPSKKSNGLPETGQAVDDAKALNTKKSGKAGKSGTKSKPEKTDKPGKEPKLDKADKNGKAGKNDKAAKPKKASKADALAASVISQRRIRTRNSDVHGKGMFAVDDLAEGETLIEYIGEVVTWKEALRRHPHDPKNPNHTFYFHIDEKHVIDAKYGGNSSRWINHSCAPNCEADEEGGRVFIKALRNISAGEELFYDYGLIIDAPYTKKLKAEYPCWCGAPDCRGTLLAPKRGKKG